MIAWEECDVFAVSGEEEAVPKRRGIPRILLGALIAAAIVGSIVLVLATGGSNTPKIARPDPPNEWVFVDAPRIFLWGDRRIEVKNPALQHVVAYFVTFESEKSTVARAESCVRTELARFEDATCYAFESVDAIEAAQPSRTGDGVANACWIAFARGVRTGTTAGIEILDSGNNPAYDGTSCPESEAMGG